MKRPYFAAVLSAAFLLTACVSQTEVEKDTAVPEFSGQITEISYEITESETSSVSVSETTSETTTVTSVSQTTTVTTTELPFEDNPDNAYQRLYASFEDPDGNISYPEDYGGVWTFGSTLFVAITEYTPPERYTNILSDYTCVRYKTVTFSFNRLSEISLEAGELLDPDFEVAECYVDVPSNKAAVSIKKGNPKQAQNFLKTIPDLDFTLGSVEISMAPEETTDINV